jgi:GDP-4-dehydro-6-deoxy-D-mannose reductase
MGRRILVTGGSGFVGRHFLRAANDTRIPSDDVLVIASDSPRDWDPSLANIRVIDVRNPAAVESVVADFRPTHTLHLAGLASPTRAAASPALAWAVNVGGAVNVTAALAAHVPDSTLLAVSTGEVYRVGADREMPGGANAYARSKAAAEAAVLDIAPPSMRVVILRPFNHTGPGQDEEYVVPAFAMQIARIERGMMEPRMMVGDLTARRDFLDVRDVVGAYWRLIGCSEQLPHRSLLDIRSGVSRSIRDVLESLKALATCDFGVEIDPERSRRNAHVSAPVALRAHTATPFHPEISWEQTLKAVLEDCRRRVALDS